MSLFSWLSSAIGNRKSVIGSGLRRKPKAGSRKPPRFRPRLEVLEGRDVPSTLTVMNNLDSGPGSLRADIAAANSGDTIVFDQSLKGKTITLAGSPGELYIDKNLDIEGLGAKNLAISGGGYSRVFEVATGVQVTLAGMTIENGNSKPNSNGVVWTDNYYDHGGGILNRGTLTLNSCTVSGNTAYSVGGGIANEQGATMTIAGCTLSRNTVYGELPVQDPYSLNPGGGGIYNDGTMTLSGSTVTQNSAVYTGGYFCHGGGILNGSSGSLTVLSSTVKGNKGGVVDIYSYGYLSIDSSSTIGTVYQR